MSKRNSVLARRKNTIRERPKTQKSSKMKSSENEILASPDASKTTTTSIKNRKNQAKQSQVKTRFCPRPARHPRRAPRQARPRNERQSIDQGKSSETKQTRNRQARAQQQRSTKNEANRRCNMQDNASRKISVINHIKSARMHEDFFKKYSHDLTQNKLTPAYSECLCTMRHLAPPL